jgi:hypothetical protein
MKSSIRDRSLIRWNLKIAIMRSHGTATRFARLLGISRQQLSHIIVGREPGWPYRKKIAAILGHDEEWLFKQGVGNGNGDHQ